MTNAPLNTYYIFVFEYSSENEIEYYRGFLKVDFQNPEDLVAILLNLLVLKLKFEVIPHDLISIYDVEELLLSPYQIDIKKFMEEE